GLVRVARAGGLEAAASRKQERKVRLIDAQREKGRLHTDRLPRLGHFALRSRACSSSLSAAKFTRSTPLLGCTTMSHPAGIPSCWQRTISLRRRRIRLRTTALPSAFLMLNPKRLCGSELERKKTVK